jgi:phosphoadenosine phosphosulfate reductase
MTGKELVISPEVKSRLEQWPAEEVLLWACQTFGTQVAATSSFQTQSVPLLYLISRSCPDLRVLFVDTGYHFPDTLAFRDSLTASFNLNVQTVREESSTPEFVLKNGDFYPPDPHKCCALRKVAPLQKAISGYQAWITGIRRDQTALRSKADIVEFHGNIIKINPLINWTQSDIDQFIEQNNLPRHPLDAKGYKSIGCYPCTQPVAEADSFRVGRWANFSKQECGIHCMSTPIYHTTVKIPG